MRRWCKRIALARAEGDLAHSRHVGRCPTTRCAIMFAVTASGAIYEVTAKRCQGGRCEVIVRVDEAQLRWLRRES
jgi:hypothetical protein